MKRIRKDRVLIEKVKIENKNSLIDILPEENAPVIGRILQKGELVEDLKSEDLVYYKESDSLPITIEGKNLFILREFDIIGIV